MQAFLGADVDMNRANEVRPIFRSLGDIADVYKRQAHEGTVILHEAAAKALKAAGISKLPNLAALQAEYEKLQEQKETLRADYGKLKKQVREYDVIKQNIDSILRQPREPEREKEAER